jgi:hypothetical protein
MQREVVFDGRCPSVSTGGLSVISCVRRYPGDAGWSSPVARWAHNPEVAGSNPAPATTRAGPRSEAPPSLVPERSTYPATRAGERRQPTKAPGSRSAACSATNLGGPGAVARFARRRHRRRADVGNLTIRRGRFPPDRGVECLSDIGLPCIGLPWAEGNIWRDRRGGIDGSWSI